MIWSLLVGLVIGVIAKMLMPGKDPGGFFVTALLGVAGSAIAHFIGVQAGMYREGEPAGMIASIIGAIVILAAYRAVTGNNNRSIPH
jgi:uncharacterized membrane protein YeaQ/YmgE (transglycosylase-associated protein family)